MSRWLTLTSLAIGNLITACSISLQAPFFPLEAEMKGATPTQYGLVFGIFELTVLLVAPIYGKIVALVTPKFMLDTGMFVMGVCGVLFGLLDLSPRGTPFIALSFIVRIAEGLGCGAYTTASFTITAAEFPNNVATTFGTLQTAFGFGMIIGPTLGGVLYEVGGYLLPFAFLAGVMILCSLFTWWFLPKTDKLPDKKTGDVVKFWAHPGVIMDALVIAVSFLCLGYCQATLEPHIRQFDLSPVKVGLIFIVLGGMYATGAPAWGWLCDHLCNARILSICSCVLSCCGLLFLGPASFIPIDTKLWLVIVSLIVFGCGFAGCLVCPFVGSLKDTTQRGFPDDLTTYGLVSSLFSVSNSLGAFIGPSFGGYLLETVGFRQGTVYLLIMQVALLIALCLYVALTNHRSGRHGVDERTPLMDSESIQLTMTTSNGNIITANHT